MLFRIQADADDTGQITSLTVIDGDLVTDPVTGQKTRGPLRQTVVTAADAPALFTAINGRFAGGTKAQERLDALKARRAAEQAAQG